MHQKGENQSDKDEGSHDVQDGQVLDEDGHEEGEVEDGEGVVLGFD